MRGLFLDASDDLADVYHAVVRPGDPPITVNEQAQVPADALPGLLAGYGFVLNDHTFMPVEAMRGCTGLKHVIFLGTGARSYMDPEGLAGLGITVHTIKGYGDIAVAEHAVALMWAAARGLARMDGGMRAGQWLRTEGMQLTGKTIGLVGFGGIAAEVEVRGHVVDLPRAELHARIDARLDAMIAAGALDEIAALARRALPPGAPVMKALGVPPLLAHLRGETSLATAIERTRIDTRHYAKRQQTWYRNQTAAWPRGPSDDFSS